MDHKPFKEDDKQWEERWRNLRPAPPPPILRNRFLSSVSAQSLSSQSSPKDPRSIIPWSASFAAAAAILIALFVGFPRQLGKHDSLENSLTHNQPLAKPTAQDNVMADSSISGKRVILGQEALDLEISEDGQAVRKTRVRGVDQIEFNDPDSRERLRISIPREWVISSQVTTM